MIARLQDGTAGAGEPGTDLFAVGLLLSIVGCFLLANSIVFRHPRTLVAQFFGGEEQRLTSIRSYIFHRVQVHLGFLFLLGGFGLQLYGHFRPPATTELVFPTVWVGFVALAVVVLELLGWGLSQVLFRRYVREYFRAHPPSLETDMALSRELGELFGIPSEGDDSVQSYLLRIRQRIGIVGLAPGPSVRHPGPLEEVEVEEDFRLSS
jgi:hypothetical protein